CRNRGSTNALQRWAVRILLAAKSPPEQGTHITEIEILVNRSSGSVGFQILLDPLWRQDQTSLFQSRHRLVVVRGSFLQAEFLGEEKKSLVFFRVVNTRNREWAADRTPEILPAVEWDATKGI